jgi:ABC-type branched-subunit amino acid transport system ATPase component
LTPPLVVHDLSAGYGGATVLRGVSLEVPPGAVVCVMGRNGAGKTTLLRALMGVLPAHGRVELAGRDVTGWPGHRIRAAGMAWVPQDDAVFPGLTVRQHLALAQGEGAGATGAATDLFPILGERLDQEAQTLSGGERKMLGIAQALVAQPEVLLMDEPTEGVAPLVVAQLVAAIAATAARTSVLLVEQNVDTAVALGSGGYVLENGTVVEQGPIADLHRRGVLEQRLAL